MFSSIQGCIDNPISQPTAQKQSETGIDFANLIPREVTHKIFSYLSAEELGKCPRASKTWQLLATDKALWDPLTSTLLKGAFGKEQWKKYFGEIGQEPPVPQDIYKILKSPCPFWRGKKVEETHMLVLIPETINGKALNLKRLGKIIRAPKEGLATRYRHDWPYTDGYRTPWCMITKDFGSQATPKSHWVLMTKDVIEGSRNKTYSEQQAFVTALATQTGIPYEFPNLLDAVICIFMHYVTSQKPLFSANHNVKTFIRCQEKVQGYPITVGAYSEIVGTYPYGLDVEHNFCINDITTGVAVQRKFL